MVAPLPSPHEGNGRDEHGKFSYGNKCARGNPLAGRAMQLRAELLAVLTPEAIHQVAERLLERALKGNLKAIAETLDRSIGKASQMEVIERVELLEARLAELESERADA